MIRFDHRERILLARWKGPKRVEDLPLGDIIVGHILIERKAEGDFAASIKDGRWREQKSRLLEQRTYRPMYIIEGEMHGLPKKALYGALCNTILRDRIHIIRTSGISETLCVLQLLLDKSGTSIPRGPPPRKKRKREEHTLQRILESIPGVSERMAGVIVGSFPTLGDIQHALKHTPEALEKLAHTPKRRIGPAVVRNLQRHLV